MGAVNQSYSEQIRNPPRVPTMQEWLW